MALARAGGTGQRRSPAGGGELAESLRPESPIIRLDCGKALLAAEDYEGAEEHLREAARLSPDPYQAFSYLGLLAARQGQQEEAKSYYYRAIEVRPDAAIALNNLAERLLAEGEDLPLALALAYAGHIGSQESQRAAMTSDTLTKALIQCGYPAMAIRLAHHAAQAKPQDAGRQLRLAQAAAAAGARDVARTAAAKCLELEPDGDMAEKARELARDAEADDTKK